MTHILVTTAVALGAWTALSVPVTLATAFFMHWAAAPRVDRVVGINSRERGGSRLLAI